MLTPTEIGESILVRSFVQSYFPALLCDQPGSFSKQCFFFYQGPTQSNFLLRPHLSQQGIKEQSKANTQELYFQQFEFKPPLAKTVLEFKFSPMRSYPCEDILLGKEKNPVPCLVLTALAKGILLQMATIIISSYEIGENSVTQNHDTQKASWAIGKTCNSSPSYHKNLIKFSTSLIPDFLKHRISLWKIKGWFFCTALCCHEQHFNIIGTIVHYMS